ncbi:helix-turn-helix domain-containing protein [Streptomyces sp. NPDC008317]|uniref:helix-turn-helix domain-containing protein n=1 Tax=Streptomyces sp. NPDC008317 TaxID=3364827 RepID=UPI0036E773AF
MFDRDDLSPPDRLAALNELFVTSEHPMSLSSREAEDFRASARTVDLAAVNVVELRVSPSQVVRTPKMVRQADPELLCLAMAPSGKLVMSQLGREAVLESTDIALYDSSRPFGLQLGAGGEPTTLVRVHIPRAQLGQPADRIERLLARPLPGQAGFAGMLVHFLTGLTTQAAYRPDDLGRLARISEDLLTAVVAHHLDAEAALREDSRGRTLLLSVEAFVQQHLHDPDLSPTHIADALHVSVGYLHRLFTTRETTLAAWIRRLRLERARRDLRDPALRDLPIHRIAARWGFKDHSTFTRSFRTAYHLSPRDYRHATGSSEP